MPTEEWGLYLDAAGERAGTSGWWQRYDPRQVPTWMSLYMGLERNASTLRVYDPF